MEASCEFSILCQTSTMLGWCIKISRSFIGLVAFVVACGGSVSDPGGSNSAGTGSTGGQTSTGGPSAGGNVVTGGSPTIGGANDTGGIGFSGGAAGVGGAQPTGGSTYINTLPIPGGPCRTASDCKMVSTCCDCDVFTINDPSGGCSMDCIQNKCEKLGIAASEVACVAGRCVFARSCNTQAVTCPSVPPQCPTGQVPSVDGNCYGPCLPIGNCAGVSSCDTCKSVGLACVTNEILSLNPLQNPDIHCVSTPTECAQNPTCSCMAVCESSVCSEPDSTNLYCSCPTC